MKRETVLVQQIEAVSRGNFDVVVCTQEMQALNQAYIQSAMQAVYQNAQEDLGEILKGHRRLRKAIAGLQRTEQEVFAYECGIFNGAYKILQEMDRIYMEQEECRNSLELLERKYVRDIMDYLSGNPFARHGSIAEKIKVSPSYLSEILKLLVQAGFVERDGKNKSTRYYLTKAGRQHCRTHAVRNTKTEYYIDITDFKEIQDKENFLKCRSGEYDKSNLKMEDRYGNAKRKENFRNIAEAVGR